jgi:hypothetical protein
MVTVRDFLLRWRLHVNLNFTARSEDLTALTVTNMFIWDSTTSRSIDVHVPSKWRWISTGLHGVTFQKIVFLNAILFGFYSFKSIVYNCTVLMLDFRWFRGEFGSDRRAASLDTVNAGCIYIGIAGSNGRSFIKLLSAESHQNMILYNCLRITNSMELNPYWEAPIVQPLKNFPTFYGTRRFITVFTRALHWSLSWARSIQSISPNSI